MSIIVDGITTSSATVKWTWHSEDVARYIIELRFGSETGALVPGGQDYQIPRLTTQYTFTGLQSGTRYHAKVYSRDSSNTTIKVETITFSTLSDTKPSAPTLYLSASGRTVYISGTAGANTDYITLYRDGSYLTDISVISSSSYSYSFVGAYSRSYTIQAVPEDRYGVVGTSVTKTITTGAEPLPDPPPAPTNFRITSSGETSVTFSWNSVSSANFYGIEIYSGTTRVDYDYNISGLTKTFSGLATGVDYEAKLYGRNESGNGTPVFLSFRLGYSRPSNFSWDIAKVKNRSYSRNSSGQLTNFMTASELSKFQARINDFRRYKGLSAYSFTIPSRGMEFTASMYNQLRTAINSMNPPTSVPAYGYSGTGGVVDKLNDLVSSLNSIS